MGRIAACHAAELEDTLGVVGLVEGDPGGILTHFDAEVEAEEVDIAHVECLLHPCLEHLHLLLFSAGDDEIVDVDANSRTLCLLPRWYTATSCALCLKPIFLSVASSFAFQARDA